MLAFQEGKAAAAKGIDHFDNPYSDLTREGNAWGSGWLVGKDPEQWGDLEQQYVNNTETTNH